MTKTFVKCIFIYKGFCFLKFFMIRFEVNGEVIRLEKEISVVSLLSHLDIAREGIAVAINRQVISKESWVSFFVKDADKVLIIKATQGG